MKTAILLFFGMLSLEGAIAQQPAKAEITLTSSIQCGECKDRIEKGLAYEKGIQSVRADIQKNEIKVVYKPSKISEAQIKNAINAIGYAAGDQLPTEAAIAKLPDCCKPNHGKH